MLLFMFRIPLGRARVICLMIISPAKQLFLNNAFFYLTAFSKPRAHSECDQGQETLLYLVHRTQCADRVTFNATTWEHCQIIIAWCLVVNLLGWERKARIADTSHRYAKSRTTASRGHNNYCGIVRCFVSRDREVLQITGSCP